MSLIAKKKKFLPKLQKSFTQLAILEM